MNFDPRLSDEQISQLTRQGECYIHTHPVGPIGPQDFIEFNARMYPARVRRMGWNETDQTLDLGLEYGVTQQVGQEYYVRVINQTASTIPSGTVVGYVGGFSTAVSVSPYLADGSRLTTSVLGVMTHDMPVGSKGYCTAFGFVRELDTSAFAAGDLLYPSPTVAGALTNVKPTAPNNVIIVGACIVSDATQGVIFVRPAFNLMKYYGVFSSSTSFPVAAIYTPYTFTYNNMDSGNGVTIGSPSSRIVVPQSGLYKFDFSVQVEANNAAIKKIWVWPRKNGVNVPNSNGEVTIAGGDTVLVPSWSWLIPMAAGDYFEVVYAADSTGVSFVAKPAQTGANGSVTFARPSTPSIILEVTQAQQ